MTNDEDFVLRIEADWRAALRWMVKNMCFLQVLCTVTNLKIEETKENKCKLKK